MTVVVADTSPLNYLILIEAIDTLARLYGNVVIPAEVLGELKDDGAPEPVKAWATSLPEWVMVRSAPHSEDPVLYLLDEGERSAILLAQSEPEVLLLIDGDCGTPGSRQAKNPPYRNYWHFASSLHGTLC